ncbi:MAG: phosphotransferase [Actinomycetota bacterium]
MTDSLDPPVWIASLLGARARVVGVVGGGTSRDTLLLEVPPSSTRVVARHDGGAGPLSGTAFTLAREAATFAAVRATGTPVPEVLAVASDGSAFAVTEVPGAPARGDDALDDYLAVLGRLHATGLDLAPTGHVGFDAAGAEDLQLWASIAEERIVRPAPLVATALGVLRAAGAARPPVVALCHGDAGPGNYLHADGRVTGLVDWEMAHTGDPHDDLASIAVRAVLTGADLGDYRRRIVEHWEPASGLRFDDRRFLVAAGLVLTRMVVSCLVALDHPDPAKDRTVQLMGLPLMEVHLVRTLGRLTGRTLAPPDQVAPEPAFAAEAAGLVAEGIAHDLVPLVEGAAAARARRLGYLAGQLERTLASVLATAPSDPDDPLEVHWLRAHQRLAVVPASRSLALAPLPGAPPC